MRPLAALRGWLARLRPAPVAPLRGPGAELARSVSFSTHAVQRFVERGPYAPGDGDATAALRRLVAAGGRRANRPPKWFGGKRAGSAFWIVVDDRYVLPVSMGRPGQLARRGMNPYVATTFVARRRR
ncbi:MAG TPA: hypothetical protein VIL64_01820 [Solirubrobacteraceae bacterium]